MRQRDLYLIGASLVGVGVIVAVLAALGSGPQPSRPALAGESAGSSMSASPAASGPGSGIADIDTRVAFWEARVAANDRDFSSTVALFDAYLERARSTGDLGDLGRAQAALDHARQLEPGGTPALDLREGQLHFSLHEFGAARDAAQRFLDADPGNASGLALLGDSQLELGDEVAAKAAYDALAAKGRVPGILSRLARYAFLTGDVEHAITLVMEARDAVCDTNPDVNFFAGFNATAIVLEVPDADLGGANIGVWAETRIGGSQIDRMGKPAINTVFNTTDADKNAYNAAEPANDPADWTANVAGVTSAIRQALGEAPAAADAYGATLAGLLLPDVLNYDTTTAANYGAPLNGRALTDDVIDISYSVITSGAPTEVTSDCVANDSTFRPAFPYWGVANAAAATPTPVPTASPTGSTVPTASAAAVPNTSTPSGPIGTSGLLKALAVLLLFGGVGTLTAAEIRRRNR